MNLESMSREDLVRLVEAQREQNKKNIVIKVSPKGCVQINGIRKFPVTFYKNEWEQIFGLKAEIEQFIIDHDNELATK